MPERDSSIYELIDGGTDKSASVVQKNLLGKPISRRPGRGCNDRPPPMGQSLV
jgi:hypothetical protein